MKSAITDASPPFLQDGGEMGARVRALDWSATPFGAPTTWPPALRVMVAACLNSPLLTTVLWGPDLRMIYNDAYALSLADRHPRALGRPVADVWGTAWETVRAPFLRTMATGIGFAEQNVRLEIHRFGRQETTWWNIMGTPIRDEAGAIVGLLNQGVEITQAVAAQRRGDDDRKRLAQMFEQGPSFMALLEGPSHRITRANSGYLELVGNRAVIGKTIAEALPDAVEQGHLELLDEVYASGTAFRAHGTEYAVQAAPGEPIRRRFVDFVFQPIKSEAGCVTGIFVEGADKTEETLANAALRKTEQELRVALAAGRLGTWTLDLATQDLVTSITCRAHFGRAPDAAFTYTQLLETVHPDDRQRMRAAVLTSIRSGADYDIEYRIVLPDGEERWVGVRAQVIRGHDGKPVSMSGVSVDITDRLRLEQALRSLNEELEVRVEERTRERDRIWRNSHDLITVIDLSGTLLSINPAAKAMLGWDREEMLGRRVTDFIHPDDHPAMREGSFIVEPDEGPRITLHRILCKDGSYRSISWLAGIEDGLVYSNGRDITVELQQAQALREAEDALRQAQKMEAVGQLTGGIAHDFNNLLMAISGSLQLLQTRIDQGRTGEVEKYANAAQAATQRAAALTHRLLAFSRRQTLDPKPVDVDRLLAGMDEILRRAVGPDVTLEVHGAAGLWPTLVDPHQLENAVLNLCINSRDAMPDGGRITFATANRSLDERAARERGLPPGEYLAVSVSDTGAGMSPAVVQRAFEPFFTTKPLGMGTGLGLSMIYGFARQSGGQVRIATEVGKGTTMSLYLPRHHGVVPGAETRAATGPDLLTGRRGTVLIVDDEPTVRMLIADVLSEAGFDLLEAGDGPSALAILHSSARVDLLITDVGLPGGMNGRQVADAARVRRIDLKVLFITGYAENAVVGNGHLDRHMAILTKPFEIDALKNKVSELLAADPSGEDGR